MPGIPMNSNTNLEIRKDFNIITVFIEDHPETNKY